MKSLHSMFMAKLLSSGSMITLLMGDDDFRKIMSTTSPRINGATGHHKLIKGLDGNGDEISEVAWCDNKTGLQSEKSYSKIFSIENTTLLKR